jgi:CheY-like chemotaxis protein
MNPMPTNIRQALPPKRHVLIVDDDAAVAQAFKQLLEKRGYEATTAPNGAEALKHVLHGNADAVICDLGMPQLEGDAFYRTVERVNPGLASRFIVVTGLAANPHFQPFFDRVGCPILQKPVPTAELLAVLDQLWEQTRRNQALE